MTPHPFRPFFRIALVAFVFFPAGPLAAGATGQSPAPTAAQRTQAEQDAALFATIKDLDAKLFQAYNTCDLATLGSMVSDNLEFYHDQTGLSTGKEPFLQAIKQNICGKVQRTLLPETLEVYPLNHYGAVEIGVHRFTHPDRPGQDVGDAKFVMLWQNKDGGWKITRVISYEHNRGLLAK
jgi:ketosteroid isomerase-like protein